MTDPQVPLVSTESKTSDAYSPSNPFIEIDTNYPLWDDWDSVVVGHGSIGWHKHGNINDTFPQAAEE